MNICPKCHFPLDSEGKCTDEDCECVGRVVDPGASQESSGQNDLPEHMRRDLNLSER